MSAGQQETDHYRVLGLSPRANANEILASYRQLAKKWHPDKSLGDPQATARFQRLNEAYTVLKDPVTRAQYDGRNRPHHHHHHPQPRNQKPKAASRARAGHSQFYTFQAGSSWSDSFNAVDPNNPREGVRNPMDEKVREMRRRVYEDDDFIIQMQSKQAEARNAMDKLWGIKNEALDSLKEVEASLAFIKREYQPLMSLAEARRTKAEGGNLSGASRRLVELVDEQQKQERKLNSAHRCMDEKRELIREAAAAIEERTKLRVANQKKLDELGKSWRQSEFNEGNEDMGSSTWSGWNGWCGWDSQETEAVRKREEEREKAKEKETPWWVAEEERGRENTGKDIPKKEDTKWTNNQQAPQSTRTWTDGWVDAVEDTDTENELGEDTGMENESGKDNKDSKDSKDSKEEAGEKKRHTGEEAGREEAGSSGTKGSVGSDSDADLLDLDDRSAASKDLDQDLGQDRDLDNAWWPEAHKIEEATRVWERCENEWRQASCQEW